MPRTAKPKQPKSELKGQSESYINFTSKEGNYLMVEKNVGQYSFQGAPNPDTDFIMVAVDGDEWFLSKGDATLLKDWLTKALS